MIDWKCTLQRWVWLCPYAMMGLAVVVLLLFGVSTWTAIVAVILLVCPVILLWGGWQVWRRKP